MSVKGQQNIKRGQREKRQQQTKAEMKVNGSAVSGTSKTGGKNDGERQCATSSLRLRAHQTEKAECLSLSL